MALNKVTVGIAAGLAPDVSLELKTRILAEAAAAGRTVEVLMDWTPVRRDAQDPLTALRDKKMYAFDSALKFQREGADLVAVPSVDVQKFLPELQAELTIPVADWLDAVGRELAASGVKKVGVLRRCGSFCAEEAHGRVFQGGAETVKPSEDSEDAVREAAAEIRAYGVSEQSAALMAGAAEEFRGKVDAVLPMHEAAALAVPALQKAGLPAVDTIGIYARAIVNADAAPKAKPFKLGLIGGLGPAATVDLFDKIVKATPAKNDQEHFKLVIEENPQIPDRTACLLNGGTDPTLSLYHAARTLEEDGCDAVIIPCNTAHAFLPYIRRSLKVPFIDMQQTALEDIASRFASPRIGLMATSGTVQTGIYSKKAEAMGLPLFVPDEERQQDVMNAIYGPKGAKAGFTDGECREQLLRAADYLVREHGCNVLILGCTELPLILDETDEFPVAGTRVAIVDPTAVLARKVAKLAIAENAKRGTR